MHLRLLFNPAAGRGRARRHIREAADYLRSGGATVDVTRSDSPEHLTQLAAESSRDGYDRVVVCGGDGSLNLAVRDFDFSRSTLGLLPLGSGDDFAKVCRIPRSLRGACDLLLDGEAREVDVAVANGRRYLGVAGLGFDSEVARYANDHATLLRGSLVYLYAIFKVLPQFKPHRVAINGIEHEIMFSAVGNSSQYGGGIRITPAASVDDGELDLCVVHKATRFDLLKTLPRAYTGSHVKSSFVESRRGTVFTFESERPLEVFADGEAITTTPVKIELAAERLRIVTPAAS